ncbi:cob(I)yrinic acid a,c-diamide adenosyltransferase [Clostridium sp. WILCCON 0269]|uniref:Cob(I)yrinic acid a,c-diamide adenosyltransferase n=1 Tax=Candidatus Clostridium eludens TaxID=3381663 RepID=A0ABW8SNM1_9CLOT
MWTLYPEDIVTERGLVMVITGNGKGKTTSAFGQALRAIGHGYKVLIIQFMKGRKYGEVLAAEKYLSDLTIIQCGLDSFVTKDNPDPVDLDLAKQGMQKAQEAVQGGQYDLIVLDEINVAVDFKLIPEQEVIDLIRKKPFELTLLLTGRYASDKIKKVADMVSDVNEVKHHYKAGIEGRAGIEY